MRYRSRIADPIRLVLRGLACSLYPGTAISANTALLLCFLTALFSSMMTFLIVISQSRIQPRGIRTGGTSQPYIYGAATPEEHQTLVEDRMPAEEAHEEGQTI